MPTLLIQLIDDQRVMMNMLLSRLSDRCEFCHREIVDQGGVVDENEIHHWNSPLHACGQS